MKFFVNRSPRELRATSIQLIFIPGAAFLAVLAWAADFSPGWARWVAVLGVFAGFAIAVVARLTDWVTSAFTVRVIAATMVLTTLLGLSIQPPAIGVLIAFVFLGIAVGASAFLRMRQALPISVLSAVLGLVVIPLRSSIPIVAAIIFLALMTITTIAVIVLRQSLQAARDEAIALSLTDALTGLANRRSMEANVPLMSALAERTGQHLGCLVVDLDNFKAVNDTYGHLAGDQILIAIADSLRQSTRDSDLCVRIGGDEFCVFTVVNNRETLQLIAERLRSAIEALDTVPLTTVSVGGSVSAGTSSAIRPNHGLDEFLRQADRALYQAKAAGRNLIQID